MATADDEITTTWLTLGAACKLKPEPVLVRRLGEEKTRSRGLTKDGTAVEIPSQFWRQDPIIDQDRSSAHTRFLSPAEWWFYQIEVLCDAAVPLEPPPPGGAQTPADLSANSTWVVTKLGDLLKAGKISPRARITKVSKELANLMSKERPTKALKPRSIENMLRNLELWPPVK